MRTFIITLATLFALALAWSPSNDMLNPDNHAELVDYSNLQFFASSSNRHSSHANIPPPERLFEDVPLPPSRNYVLGPPKFPANIMAGTDKEYCSANLTEFKVFCAGYCEDAPLCRSYYIFEATNSGTPKLPYWYCYILNTILETKDFVYNVEANFAHAYSVVIRRPAD